MSTPDTATAPEPSIDDDPSAVPATRRPLTVALGIMLLLGAIIAAASVVPTPRWDLWLVGVLALLGASLGLLVIALMPREIHRGDADRQGGELLADEADPTAVR